MASKKNQTQSSYQGMFPPIENVQQFRQFLVMSLSKFSEPHTVKIAHDEARELMTEHITNTDRMNAFLHALSETNEHMKVQHKKELIKLYGEAAEIFEEALLPFLSKILQYLQKKLRDNDQTLHEAISDSMGALVHQILKKIGNLDELLKEFNPILSMLFTNIALANKVLQVGSSMCLTRVIQNAPVIVLQSTLSFMANKIHELLQSSNCKCHTQLLESLISLILAVETDFKPLAVQFLPNLLECMTMPEWTTRKLAVDVIYTMAAILQDVLSPYKAEILEVLNHCKTDKLKPVREATIEAITALKQVQGPDCEDSLNSDRNQHQ